MCIRDSRNDVAADLARDVNDRRRFAVTSNEGLAILDSFLNRRNITQPHRALRIIADHPVAHFLETLELRIGEDQKLLIPTIETPNAYYTVRRPQTVCQIWQRDAMGQSFLPVSYTHLRAHETPEHLVCRLLL